ncbi:sugar transferase [Gordonia sputi]
MWTPERESADGKLLGWPDKDLKIYQDRDILSVVRESGATTVAIGSSENFSNDSLRELSWELEALDVQILVAPGVIDVAGPRMHVRQVDGLPLLHIDRPRYGAAQSILKRSLDLTIAIVALLILSPVMLAAAAAIWIDDRGPIFYRQTRVGKSGECFAVWKFRSMRVNSESELPQILRQNGTESPVFYKNENDPRITRVGQPIRRTSIDELPQIINVLKREMSIVGPRPLQPGEGASVPNYLYRRLLVKPGMTGLWQVSGRSDLAGEDRIRLDLLYVENWSLMQDLRIIWRTVRVVIGRNGAY